MKKNPLVNLAVLLVSGALSIIISVFVINLIARRQNSLNARYYSNLDWEGKLINNIPSQSNMVYKNKVRGSDIEYTAKINSQGFRDYEYSIDKPADTLRIAVVGDSITYGAGVNLEDSYVKQLERLLNNRCSKKVEALNFGVAGASTINELELIQKKVLLYEPDILMLQMDPNDCDVIKQIKKVDPFLDKIILQLKKSDSDISRWLKCKLEFYKYYRYKKRLTLDDEYNNVVVPLQIIIDVCKEHNSMLVIISYDPVYRGQYYTKVLEFIEKEGIPLLDLSKTRFSKLSYKQRYVNPELDENGFPLDAHPNKYGCSVIAEEIYNFLEAIAGFRDRCFLVRSNE
jgi:lysophospholipase L1-like esterase